MTGFLGKWLRMPTLAERLRSQGVREDVVHAAERTVFGRQTDRSLPALADLLGDSEAVVQLIEARWEKQTGLFALTSRRLLFLPAPGRPFGIDMPLSDVDSIECGRHRGMGTIDVLAGQSAVHIDQILGNQAETITSAARRAMAPPPDGPPAYRDPLEQLAELRALHAAGAISDQEFVVRKSQLFDEI